jgi:hypothetical protein
LSGWIGLNDWRHGGRNRYGVGHSRRVPANGAGDGFESLFERGDTGKQPVAITVQCVDSGRKSSYFLLGRFRNLQMRRLLCEIGGDNLVGPDTGTGIVSQESNDYGPD